MKKIINYEQLEKPIIEVEKILEPYDMKEKGLIIQEVRARRAAKLQKLKVSETISDHPLIKFGNKLMGKDKGDDD